MGRQGGKGSSLTGGLWTVEFLFRDKTFMDSSLVFPPFDLALYFIAVMCREDRQTDRGQL